MLKKKLIRNKWYGGNNEFSKENIDFRENGCLKGKMDFLGKNRFFLKKLI